MLWESLKEEIAWANYLKDLNLFEPEVGKLGKKKKKKDRNRVGAVAWIGSFSEETVRVLITRTNPQPLLFLFFLLHLYEKINISGTNCGNHFIIYVNQTTMLDASGLKSWGMPSVPQ